MDFQLTAEEAAFQKEVHEFFLQEVNDELSEEFSKGLGLGPLGWQFIRKLGAKGWLVPTLPEEYGGLNTSCMQRYIIMNELHYLFPEMMVLIGAAIVAPTLMIVGTEEQKKEYVLKVAKGEIEFALGYTEPNAGSDLASIGISAVEDGDCFILNGQKTFNTSCHYAQYHWLCARTERIVPKHKGLSLFIVPLDSPGITIRPMWIISGERTNEVFYDDVRVPKKNLVGQKNKGFYHMMVALNFERIFPYGHLQRAMEDLIRYVKETSRNGKLLAQDPLVRQKIAGLVTLVEVCQGMGYHVVWLLDQEKVPEYEASALKVFISEAEQQIASTGVSIMGMYGQLEPGSKYAPLKGWFERWYLSNTRRTIAGGTNEIQRNIIAQRGLGLPRS